MLLGCALLAAVGCGRGEESEPSAAPRSGEPPKTAAYIVVPPDSPRFKQLRVESVRVADVPEDVVTAPGRVTVNPNRVSRVLPPVAGRVLEVMVRLGDAVEQGQPVLAMESPDADAAIAGYLQAEASQRQTQAALAKSEADYRRTAELYEAKAVAHKDLLGAENDLVQARSAGEVAKAIREQTWRKLALLGLKPTDFKQQILVRAPISGKILDLNVAPGENRAAVSFNTDTTAPLMTIVDLSTVWVSSDVPETFMRLIHVGDHVDITLVAYPDEKFSGRVARMADVLDPQTRTLKVHVDMPNPKGRLRPEMFGSIYHAGGTRPLPVVPAAAVVQEYGRSIVFLERAPGQFERREVTTGVRLGQAVSVLSGLQPNDRVVVDGAVLLKDQ
jgi:cobalt-zinc-cadmium efflux system membrane fusion protein